MPSAVIGALVAGAAALGAAAATGAAITLATFAVPAAITLGVGIVARAFAPKAPSLGGLGDRGSSESTINESITPARWIVGTQRVTGRVVWVWVEEDPDKDDDDDEDEESDILHMAMVISEGACEGIEEIFMNGEKIAPTKEVVNGHNVFTYPGFELHEYFKADGTEGAESFAAAAGYTPPDPDDDDDEGEEDPAPLEWSASTVKGEGLSWVYIKLTQNEWGTDLDTRRYTRVPALQFVVKGVKISSNRNPKQGTPEYTENAAIVRKWWLTERRGVDWRRIDNAYYKAAITRCDTMIDISNLPNFDSSAMSTDLARYTINGLIHSGDDVTAIEQDMDFAWDGAVVDWDGKLLFRPGGQRTSVREITGDDVVEEPVYRPGTSLAANRFICDIPESEWHDYLPYTLRVDDPGKQVYDGKIETLNLGRTDLVTNPAQAANLLRSAARRARAGSSLELTVMPGDDFTNAAIIPGDKVTVNLPEMAIIDQEYFVHDTRVLPGWAIKLALVEWGSDWYDDAISLDHYTPRQVLGISGISAPAPVTATIAAAVGDDGKYYWLALVTLPVTPWEMYIRYKLTSATDWIEANTFDAKTVLPVNAAGEWTFEVRARSRDGRMSPATTVTATADFNVMLPGTPTLARSAHAGSFIRYVLTNLTKFIHAVEIAYTFEEQTSTDTPGTITAADWAAAEKLGQYPIVPAMALTDERTVVAQLPKFGKFNVYARAIDIVGRQSAVFHLGLLEYFLMPPMNVNVDEYGDGTRAYLWELTGSEHEAGCVIRYKRAGTTPPNPDDPLETDTKPPVLATANVNGDGDVVLGYGEDLNSSHVPDPSAFSVKLDGTATTPTAVDISRNIVTLTMPTAITAGQAVLVSYTTPATNPLQDAAGNSVADSTDVTVNNILRNPMNEPEWAAMEPLHDGYLTASPYLAKVPSEGIWDIAFRTQSVSGELSAIARVQVRLGNPFTADLVDAVKRAIADNPALITLDEEVKAAEAARDRALQAATSGEASATAAAASKDAAAVAQTAAEAAKAAVDSAKTAVDKAKEDAATSAATAATEASTATAEAGKAATSATEADGSETAAAAHVESAKAESKKAGDSATAAADSASTAATSASEAGTSASAAKTAETKAETAQAAAETAQTQAASSATDADGSATAAASSASGISASVTAAKAAADDAETAKDDAETAESNAEASATAAATSASTASAKADDAGDEATAAAASATKAETAQSKAETAESNAASSATAADGSADAAASSASGISASVTAAKAAADDAETAKDEAEAAKSGIESSATAAASSASDAKASAADAKTQADVATTQATEAKTQASNAGTAATNAASSETAADGSATAAAASADAAAASASSVGDAKTSADAAATSAMTASAKAGRSCHVSRCRQAIRDQCIYVSRQCIHQ